MDEDSGLISRVLGTKDAVDIRLVFRMANKIAGKLPIVIINYNTPNYNHASKEFATLREHTK